jgi:hypothetical protein
VLSEDEFMLVRKRDNAKVIGRLFLTETGISQTPCFAHTENRELAFFVNRTLDSESRASVSFGAAQRSFISRLIKAMKKKILSLVGDPYLPHEVS